MTLKVISISSATSGSENAHLCGPCGGECCQSIPGSVLPSDLANDTQDVERRVRTLLATGRYALDAFHDWTKNEPADLEPEKRYFLRPAVKGLEGQVLDESWGGVCTFHSTTGCELAVDDRPGECKLLVPAPDKKCGYPEGWAGRASAATAWAPYQSFLEDLIL